MKNTRDSLRPRIKVKKPYRRNTHYTTLFIWSSNQAQRSGCQSFWWERLGIVGGATWNRSDVLFLDPGLGTQLKAGLHSSDGCLDVSNFSTECSLKYRVSHMVISITERPPVGTGAGKWWALGGCCSVKQDGEDWPHWADVVVKTWEGKGFGHIWAEGGPGEEQHVPRPWRLSSEECGHSSEWPGEPWAVRSGRSLLLWVDGKRWAFGERNEMSSTVKDRIIKDLSGWCWE